MSLLWKRQDIFLVIIQICIIVVIHLGSAEIVSVAKEEEVNIPELLPNIRSLHLQSVVKERGIMHVLYNPFEKLKDLITNLLLTKILDGMFTKRHNETCYPEVGCFYYNQSMSLKIGGPESPEDVNATFYFFKNDSWMELDDLLNASKTTVIPNRTYTIHNWTSKDVNSSLNVDLPLIVLTHGLTGSKRTPWMLPLARALLENVNCTLLVVDWEKGANGSYPDAGINTPMVGALISVFLQNVINATYCQIRPENITLIGFSMGAQVMGFAGRHFHHATNMKFGRISGLDPAGWLYENTNSTLSKNDAAYVDVIHTNAGSIKNFRIGLNQSVGHVDFYPNGGSVQTGCQSKPNIFFTNYMDVITCSHYRATHYYIESLQNHNCSFISYGCENWDDFAHGNCTKRVRQNETGLMGFYSNTQYGRGDQFLYTNSKPPYCRGNNTTPPNETTPWQWWGR